MDENTVRTLLRAIADTPGPPPAVDLDRARRHGLRGLWIRRCAAPALAMVAVAAVLTVPRALQTDHPERTVAAPQPPRTAALTAPGRFDPLVPYASFGWLPPGFSESAANSIDMGNGTASGADFVSREAAAPAAGHLLYLTVSARGACRVPASFLRQVRAGQAVAVSCLDDGFAGTGAAPDVAGRPAVWIDHGDGIAWEYAPGAWASLTASITPAADEPHSRRAASEHGWVLMPRTSADRLAAAGTPAQVRAAIRDGRLIPPSAATLALFVRVASNVRYGQTMPLRFPFLVTGELPKGWQLTRVSFGVVGGLPIGNGISAGPGVDPTALSVGGSTMKDPFGCNFVAGQSSYVTRLGVRWVYRVLSEPGKQWQSLCASRAINGVAGVLVSMDMNTPGSDAPLPGGARLGGVLGVLTRLRFLGQNAAAWTATPVG